MQKEDGNEKEETIVKLNYGDIATQLLSDKLLLTALELHYELVEAGREVPKLREFFSNPGNFETNASKPETSSFFLTRWSSQATLDSLDMARFSEDGEKAIDERIAVLEFELRKANETINSLRANLTVATECETPNRESNELHAFCEPIKPYEQKALNFLINEYLLMQGYQLTSITFADENEHQDFEVWDDVGLNIPKPPELTQLFRQSMRSYPNKMISTSDNGSQTDYNELQFEILEKRCSRLEERIKELEGENEILEKQFQKVNNDLQNITKKESMETIEEHFDKPVGNLSDTNDFFVMIQSNDESSNQQIALSRSMKDCVAEESSTGIDEFDDGVSSSCSYDDWIKLPTDDFIKQTKQDINLSEKCDRNLPESFASELISRCYIVARLPIDTKSTDISFECFIDIVANCVIRMVPFIVNNKKEEAVLLLVCIINLHPHSITREILIKLLLNTKNRPSENERKIIIGGLLWLAQNSDLSLMEEEILPQFWEQMTHKYTERRILVSEAASALALYLPSTTRNSILLPILQQILLEDKEERSRTSAVHSIALLVALIDDVEKYPQCEELALTGLQDISAAVFQATISTLLPVVAKWSLDIDRLQSHLLTRIMNLLSNQVKVLVAQRREGVGSPFGNNQPLDSRCRWTISSLHSLLPYLVINVASAPVVLQAIPSPLPKAQSRAGFAELCVGLNDPAVFYKGQHSVGVVMSCFDYFVADNMWPHLEWVFEFLISKLFVCLDVITIDQQELVQSFISLFQSLAAGFGKIVVNNRLKPIFMEKIEEAETLLANVSGELLSLCIVPVYIFAILIPMQDVEDVQNILCRFLSILPLSGYPTNLLEFCIQQLSQINSLEDILMTTLWEGVIHQRPVVRSSTLRLFVTIISNVSEFTITNRIVPAIVTLSNDSDNDVKAATIPVIESLVKKTSIKQVLDKCYFQLQTFLSEEGLMDNHLMLMQLIKTLGQIASTCDSTFREDVLVPHLANYAVYASQLTNQSRRHELARVLLEAYSALFYCPLSRNAILTTFLPALRNLEMICTELSSTHAGTVTTMIKELELQFGLEQNESAAASPSLTSVTNNMRLEMKQTVSRIFSTPIGKQNKFWKK